MSLDAWGQTPYRASLEMSSFSSGFHGALPNVKNHLNPYKSSDNVTHTHTEERKGRRRVKMKENPMP